MTHQETLDRVWQPIGDAAIKCAAALPGERAIDVGCGCGATALELAARVGPSGSVLGIDISAPMLGRARERAQSLGVANLQFVQADAATYAYSEYADLVFSRAGVMFFNDPVAAFANLRRALRPGGRLVFVCFREKDLNPWWTLPLAAAATVVAVTPPPVDQPGPFSLADKRRLQAILSSSGFVGTTCEPVDFKLVLGDDVESAVDFSIQASAAAHAVANATEEIRSRVHTAVRRSFAQYATSTGVSLRAATWLVRATNPITA